jgi:GMP synthase-like glutamine amidotransferase
MLVYVDLEHKRLRQEATLWQFFAGKLVEAKYRLEALSGQPCLIVHYERLTPGLLHELNARAVVLSGHYSGLWHYAEADLAGVRAVLREAAWPTLAVCGGFHLMALTYGATTGPMQDATAAQPETPLPPDVSGAGDSMDQPDVKQERGFMPIRVLEAHPLFEGLGRRPVVYELHSWEIKVPPEGFRVLAESELCRVQAVAHRRAPLFGTQFHPEAYDEAHPAGRKILENFIRLSDMKR